MLRPSRCDTRRGEARAARPRTASGHAPAVGERERRAVDERQARQGRRARARGARGSPPPVARARSAVRPRRCSSGRRPASSSSASAGAERRPSGRSRARRGAPARSRRSGGRRGASIRRPARTDALERLRDGRAADRAALVACAVRAHEVAALSRGASFEGQSLGHGSYEQHLRALGHEPVVDPHGLACSTSSHRAATGAVPSSGSSSSRDSSAHGTSCAHPQREIRRREQEADPQRAAGATLGHLQRRADAVRRHEPSGARPHRGRGSPRRAPAEAVRAPARSALQSAYGSSGWCVRRSRYAAIAFASRPAASSASRIRSSSRAVPARTARKKFRYGCWLGCANRRSNGWTRIAVPPSTTGNASRQSLSASPSPRYAASNGFGRSRGRYGDVGDAETHGVERLGERPGAFLGPAQERLRVRGRRRARERRRGRAAGIVFNARRARLREHAEEVSHRRANEPLDRLRLVRIAVQHPGETREVVHERKCRSRRPAASARSIATPSCQPCDALGLEQRVRVGGARSSRRRRGEQPAGPPWSTVSAAVIVSTRSVSTQRAVARAGTSRPCRAARGPAHSASCTTTGPRKRRRRTPARRALRARVAGAPRKSAGDEDRLSLDGTPSSLELVDRRREGGLTRVVGVCGSGRAGGSTTTVARPPRVTSALERLALRAESEARHGRPRRRPRSRSRRAGEARARRASSGALTTVIREPGEERDPRQSRDAR